jgi:hypothetical protein
MSPRPEISGLGRSRTSRMPGLPNFSSPRARMIKQSQDENVQGGDMESKKEEETVLSLRLRNSRCSITWGIQRRTPNAEPTT